MPRRKELDDFAETAVLPHGTVLSDLEAVRATLTASDLACVLEGEQDPALVADAFAAADDMLGATADAGAARAQASYDEYLRMLDDVPVLSDIVDEPPRVRVRDFRRGERPDARKHAREDPLTLRENHAHDLAQRYCEYVETLESECGVAPRSGTRKAAQKKSRAKRPKRSKRRKG